MMTDLEYISRRVEQPDGAVVVEEWTIAAPGEPYQAILIRRNENGVVINTQRLKLTIRQFNSPARRAEMAEDDGA